MGSRAQVKILMDDSSIYLYTHWGAEEIEATVKKAIAKKWRWDDPEYLARIIYDEMLDGETGNETGFGIGVSEHGDIEKLIIVDSSEQKITVRDTYKKNETTYSFSDCI